MDRLLDKREVVKATGLTFPTLWRKMREGTFPRSLVIGEQKVAWRASEVEAWMDALPRRRLKGDPPDTEATTPARAALTPLSPGRKRRGRLTELSGVGKAE